MWRRRARRAGIVAALGLITAAAGASLRAQGVFAEVSNVDASSSCRGSAGRPVSTFSPERRVVSVLFQGLAATAGAASSATRVECRVSFDIQAPPGMQGEFKGARYRYAIEAGAPSGAELQVRYGQRRLIMLTRWSRTSVRSDPGEHAEVIAREEQVLLTPCGGSTRVFLDITLTTAPDGKASLALDSIEFDAGDAEQFALTTCQ